MNPFANIYGGFSAFYPGTRRDERTKGRRSTDR